MDMVGDGRGMRGRGWLEVKFGTKSDGRKNLPLLRLINASCRILGLSAQDARNRKGLGLVDQP